MKIFARCFGVFILSWVVLFFVYHGIWSGPHATPASFLYGGISSIGVAVLYGLFDELWIQHRQY